MSLVESLRSESRQPWGAGNRMTLESKPLMTGRVKFFDSRKGYGFIRPDDGGQDVFLSVNVVPKSVTSIHPEARCRFQLVEGKPGKGPAAREFTLL